jgi:Tol biopolymer transport system component
MTDRTLSYRAEPDPLFADRLECLLLERLSIPFDATPPESVIHAVALDHVMAIELADAPQRRDRPARRGVAVVGAVAALVAVALIVASSVQTSDSGPAAAPADNGLIAFVHDRFSSPMASRSRIFVVAPDGTGLRAMTSTRDAVERAPTWSADGMRLAFLREYRTGEHELVVVDASTGVETSEQIPITQHGNPDALAWSPDGRVIIVQLAGDLTPLVLNLETGAWTEIRPSVHTLPQWSPDGKWLLLRPCQTCADGAELLLVPSELVGTTNLFLYDVADRPDVRRFDLHDKTPWTATWSPDSTAVAISRYGFRPLPDPPVLWIEVLTIADGARRTVIADGYAPAWSPDGRHIAYLHDPQAGDPGARGPELWVAAADGAGARRVARSVIPPVWAPDGSALVAQGAPGLFTIRPDGTDRTILLSSDVPGGGPPYPNAGSVLRGAGSNVSPAWQRLPRN